MTAASREALLAIALAASMLSACASSTPRLTELIDPGTPARIELADVPFFPQQEYQCGPAALATVLDRPDRRVTPAELVPRVYLPGRRGSLQPELVATARSYDRLPYLVEPSLDDAVAQLAGGRPVLVMQNLGWRIRPAWHFAVLVGYDAPSSTVVLRSGTTERRVMKARRFDRTWARADRWALVVLEPGELPARPDLDRYMSAAASLEAVGRRDAARAAYLRALDEWPESPWPWLGLANLEHAQGRLERAHDAYRAALERDPGHVAARHNLAETLEVRGCISRARVEIDAARALARGTPLEARVEETARRISALPPPADPPPQCPPE